MVNYPLISETDSVKMNVGPQSAFDEEYKQFKQRALRNFTTSFKLFNNSKSRNTNNSNNQIILKIKTRKIETKNIKIPVRDIKKIEQNLITSKSNNLLEINQETKEAKYKQLLAYLNKDANNNIGTESNKNNYKDSFRNYFDELFDIKLDKNKTKIMYKSEKTKFPKCNSQLYINSNISNKI